MSCLRTRKSIGVGAEPTTAAENHGEFNEGPGSHRDHQEQSGDEPGVGEATGVERQLPDGQVLVSEVEVWPSGTPGKKPGAVVMILGFGWPAQLNIDVGTRQRSPQVVRETSPSVPLFHPLRSPPAGWAMVGGKGVVTRAGHPAAGRIK